ncbi:hypothetical protein J3R74_002135 [Puniceicoccus vermicola]
MTWDRVASAPDSLAFAKREHEVILQRAEKAFGPFIAGNDERNLLERNFQNPDYRNSLY